MPENQRKRIVLKFGGSVLLDEQRLRIAVHEIYRWRREGWQVVAVVSALFGRTEELIARCSTLHPTTASVSKAAVIALGERESSTLLGVHLDRAGIPARVLTPDAVSLIATGDALDADPITIDTRVIEHALETDGVVVFPGFVAINESGETVTLGRGGSDLTAVFLAHTLCAEKCRLIKDVDALYESDPAKDASPPPIRYGYASYSDSLATDGSIIQHKAVRYAQRFSIEFELGRFNATRPTTIGPSHTVPDTTPDEPIPLSVALCGLGIVGAGVAELLLQLPDQFQITGAARHSLTPEDLDRSFPVTEDAISLASSGADIVIESIGGTSVAKEVAERAIEQGSILVTANKALLAEHGDELETLARARETRILASASVGGVMPVLESIHQQPVVAIEGIFNGTGNFILGALERGSSLNAAISQAQQLGFAEADPTRDLDGRDALDKLLVIAQQLGWSPPQSSTHRSSITTWASSSKATYPARHVACLDQHSARVIVEPVEPGSPFASTHNEWNIAMLHRPDGSKTTLRGKGAGRWPTSESVVADLLEIARTRSQSARKELSYAQ